MKKELKAQLIDQITAQIAENPNFYLTNVEGLDAEQTAALRRACFEKGVKLQVVKNTLLKKAIENNNFEGVDALYPTLAGSTAVMFTSLQAPNAPAKIIKEIGTQFGKPELKSAYIQECSYIGAEQLPILVNIKSREEMIGEIIGLLQSPIRRVVSALENAKKEEPAE